MGALKSSVDEPQGVGAVQVSRAMCSQPFILLSRNRVRPCCVCRHDIALEIALYEAKHRGTQFALPILTTYFIKTWTGSGATDDD